MPTLKYLGDSFDCTTAIKGDNYIHLLDENGVMVAAFDEIADFSDFTLENGSYTEPTDDHSCSVAVIRDDGTIGKGGHSCADIGSALAAAAAAQTTADGKADSGHKHSAEDITSGLLPVTRGGTGVGSLSELASAMSGNFGNARFAVGTYTGTGKSGSSNAQKLTFDFKPKFLMVWGYSDYIVPGVEGQNLVIIYGDGDKIEQTKTTWGSNSVSWYNNNYGADSSYGFSQMNTKDTVYSYIAIGE